MIFDQTFEGVLALQFVDKLSGYTFVVLSVYLPPDNSPWGRDARKFFCTYFEPGVYGL